jgi:hypothetical protein
MGSAEAIFGREETEVLEFPEAGKGLVYGGQQSMFGSERSVVGYGCKDKYVRVIPRDLANSIVIKNHYSGTITSSSTVHIGVFVSGRLFGVLQYGYAMNPVSCSSVVSGTKPEEYLELNRMVIDDNMPRNTESWAIGSSVKIIRNIRPNVAWIQSFADERCGRYGVVYQAANFGYYGEHSSVFWKLKNGEMVHNSLMTRDPSLTPKAHRVQLEKGEAVPITLRQFRYILFIKKGWESRCLHKKVPYPKHCDPVQPLL